MKILALTLYNFQREKSRTIQMDGLDIRIAGANGTGKTTIANAIAWLLFDRAHDPNITKFSPKPLDASGREVHNLTTSVEAIIADEDGTEFILRKEISEKWVKKRGRQEREFDGHETAYYWDAVSIPRNEFDKRLAARTGTPEQIKVLSNPAYFPRTMPWEKRRKTLFDLFGGVEDADLLARDEWTDLRAVLTKPGTTTGGIYTVDEYAAIAKAAKSKANERLNHLPGLINENLARCIVHDDGELAIIAEQIASRERHRSSTEARINELKGGDPQKVEASQQLARKKTEYEEARAAHIAAQTDVNAQVNRQINELSAQKRQLEDDIRQMNAKAADAEANIQRMTARRAVLKSEHDAAKNEKFDPAATICDKCNQPLPADRVSELEETFNIRISEAKERIRAQCKRECSQNMIKQAQKDMDTAEGKAQELREALPPLQAQLDELNRKLVVPEPFEGSDEERRIRAELAALTCDNAQAGADRTRAAIQTHTAELADIKAEIESLYSRKAAIEQSAAAKQRADDLEAEQKALAEMLDMYEDGLKLCENFIRAKCECITEHINTHFPTVRFRLFKNLINGGVEECCDVLVHTEQGHVPFGGGANTAAEVNAGLEIINVLAEKLGWGVPVVIDGAESVTSIIPIAPQVIQLAVNAECETLAFDSAAICG